ncbi:MAG: glutathionylspermidine synthase family protein [Verrucomicrobia bacterium]|nr:glutathionylspermidine synthase family protein [Verrucomicrobiota bacterium]
MRRHTISCRAGWQARVEKQGLTYHTHESSPYWDESAYYQLSAAQVDALELAANSLHAMCVEAAGAVVDRGWWSRLAIPESMVPCVLRSWERDDFSLYGRFDLAYDGARPPKLLEYNADTPTALLEASVIQWFWLQDCFPSSDQFNSIHERLIQAWKGSGFRSAHFASVKDHAEDEQTALYIQDTAHQAGLATQQTHIEDIGWDPKARCFVDAKDSRIESLFKLYPWEWMAHEEFAQFLPEDSARFVEPAWKMLLSNKGLLSVLWELFPNHPNLLPTFDVPERLGGRYARKPKLSREGQNVTLVVDGREIEKTGGDYGEEGYVFQQMADLPDFSGHFPVMGVWVVNHTACGLGIREDRKRITGNLSRFVPHMF